MTGVALAARTDGMRASKLRELVAAGPGPVLPLGGGLPPPEAFPAAELAAAAERVLAGGAAALQYAPTEGDGRLRELVAADLAGRLGLTVPPARLVVTAGSQQALDLVAKVLLDPGDVAVVESPTYVGALRAFAPYQPRFVEVPVDGHGLDTGALAGLLAGGLRPKLCYTVPNFSNPSGATLSPQRRRQLAELAAQYGFLVVEDDPYQQLRFAGVDVPPVAAGEAEHVLYLGSFSKVVAPGLRVGYAAVPEWLLRPLVVAKQAADLNTSSLAQRLVAELLAAPGWVGEHVDGLRARYRTRAAALVGAVGRRLSGRLQAPAPAGGMFVWAAIEEGSVDALALARACHRHGVAVVPGNEFSLADAFPHHLRLSYSMLDAEGLDEAVARIGRAFDALAGERHG